MYLFLGGGVVASVSPLYWMLTASTMSEAQIFKSPPRLLPGVQFSANLGGLLDAMPVIRILLNSIFVAATTTVSTVFLSALAGYAFAKFRFRGRGVVFAVVLGTLLRLSGIMIVPLFGLMLQCGV